MRFVYPDIAFTAGMQVALFVLNLLTTALVYFWGTNVVLEIYRRRVSLARRLLFGLSVSLMFHLLGAYGVAYINGILVQNLGHLEIGIFKNATKVMNPLYYIVFYWMGIRLLQLTKYQSAQAMKVLFVYFMCNSVILKIGGTFVFPRVTDPRGYNYLRDLLSICFGNGVTYVVYLLVRTFARRAKLDLEYAEYIAVHDARTELAKGIAVVSAAFLFVLFGLYYPTDQGYEFIYMALILMAYMALNIYGTYHRLDREKLVNRDEHIAALNQAVEEFRGIKHDFHNILQTYGGYMATGDYDKLRQYHQRVVDMTLESDRDMEVGRRMEENPPLFSLLLAKIQSARRRGVNMQMVLNCDMRDVYIDAVDFSRVMGVLLDNAIEEAERTVTKRVTLSCQAKPDGAKLFILSNDACGDVDTEAIIQNGYTTKEGHMGMGLHQVHAILQRYGNYALNMTCYRGSFTAYLELRRT